MVSKIILEDVSTKAPENLDKKTLKTETKLLIKELGEWQNKLYAESSQSILIVLQGMDASGKDGAVKAVFSGVNPMGCRVKSFKKPTDEEMAHDFLWRIHKEVPAKGMIQIFNRSHYEDVLIQRVEQWIDEKTVFRRFNYINQFENLLMEKGMRILKFYMHISKEEQQKRFEERMTIPRKKWKFNPNDLEVSKKWDKYMAAYESVFENCSPDIPWIIVPSDQNWYKEYLIAKTLALTFREMDPKYPV